VDTVALAATIGGSLIGLAGVGVTAWGARQQRESAKDLATSQQEHERDLARGARLFDSRAVVYEGLLTFMQVAIERLEKTEPVMTFSGESGPPDPPSREENRVMEARLRTYGSREVADAYEQFGEAVKAFYGFAFSMRTIRDQGGTGDLVKAFEALRESRGHVRDALANLERLVSNELASL
jgi:hypothetical protein